MEKFNYIATCEVDSNYQEIFYNDFAKKLLLIWKTYDHRLLYRCGTLIYNYFHSMFKPIPSDYLLEELEDIGVIDTDREKEVCEKVFRDSGEIFDTSYFGGGEYPFIAVKKSDNLYYYYITR